MADDMQEEMRGFGQYMAQLLVASNLSDEQKEAWAGLVPHMALDQMLKFATVLERYVEQSAMPELAELRVKLEALRVEYDAKMAMINLQAQSGLAEVLEEVKAAEATA